MGETTATKTGLPTGTWTLDPVHSQVEFAVRYHVGTFKGSFAPVRAKLEVAEDGTAELTGAAPVSSVKVQDENLTAHLHSPEFFDAERAPEIRFGSTSITARPDGTLEIDGELEIKGIKRPVRATGTFSQPTQYGEREYFGLQLAATIDRTSFGLNWNRELPGGRPALANEVRIETELFFVREG